MLRRPPFRSSAPPPAVAKLNPSALSLCARNVSGRLGRRESRAQRRSGSFGESVGFTHFYTGPRRRRVRGIAEACFPICPSRRWMHRCIWAEFRWPVVARSVEGGVLTSVSRVKGPPNLADGLAKQRSGMFPRLAIFDSNPSPPQEFRPVRPAGALLGGNNASAAISPVFERSEGFGGCGPVLPEAS